ncbi:MAG: (2Fe-2S)-binding protein, partial [Gemmatimonadota bacterium]
DGALSPEQRAFAECHGLQCGFCTPGFLVTVTAGLRDNPDPGEAGARELIGGNLCRCTGYQNIVAAVLRAAQLRASQRAAPPSGLTSEATKEPERGGKTAGPSGPAASEEPER